MATTPKTLVVKDLKEKSILVSRTFSAPLEKVWRAYTESELLEQWWAPQPWKAETKTMNFSVGGYWLYAMVGPENEKHWGRMDYTAITPHLSFEIKDSFCDEEGTINPSLPVSAGTIAFAKTESGTLVEFKMFYTSEKEIQTMIEMGFEQGITACLEQLETLFQENKI
ncbi:SRPBCC domain-containing protein [Flavobacterium rhamnosiphilum]|uniref:SRPBCC domain-containing protein n=1 Tax=Flavobacterium rhamnosiphilum TaxID=2541724 RepID=A0A4R5F8Z0_9FLAO|nr:SRPBCC domain-containing protein [Flavobacterium rhamnosiphilum]TDE44936.1 SRPBCC domain-containing protein [Flavobacterium rhamnosiphilum]